ncbi:MAG TPA: ABC transporter permease, partial [Kribbella sp.]|nr:ABC transporter permease [Kribbella sp.]
MIRLTGVELRRLTARRLTVIGVAGLLLITGCLLFATWLDARPMPTADQQAAQKQYEFAHKDWVDNGATNKLVCEADWQKQPDPKP